MIVQKAEKELSNFKVELYSVFENLTLCKVACFLKMKIPTTVYNKAENWNDV